MSSISSTYRLWAVVCLKFSVTENMRPISVKLCFVDKTSNLDFTAHSVSDTTGNKWNKKTTPRVILFVVGNVLLANFQHKMLSQLAFRHGKCHTFCCLCSQRFIICLELRYSCVLLTRQCAAGSSRGNPTRQLPPVYLIQCCYILTEASDTFCKSKSNTFTLQDESITKTENRQTLAQSRLVYHRHSAWQFIYSFTHSDMSNEHQLVPSWRSTPFFQFTMFS